MGENTSHCFGRLLLKKLGTLIGFYFQIYLNQENPKKYWSIFFQGKGQLVTIIDIRKNIFHFVLVNYIENLLLLKK